MTTPTQLAELIRNSSDPQDVDERPGMLVLTCALHDEVVRNAWVALRANPPPYVRLVTISDAETDAILEDGDHPGAQELFRIAIEKTPVPGELRIFFPAALKSDPDASEDVNCVQIAVMGADETFTTYRSRYQLWTLDLAPPYAPSEPLPDARAFANDFTGGEIVRKDIRPWLGRTPPTTGGAAYGTWQEVAARRLLAALSNRVSKTSVGLTYHFTGPPACSVIPSDAEVTALFPRLNEGALWLFTDNRDADTRHLLLTAEWARTCRTGGLVDLGVGSLDSARGAYAAYVNAGSRETLKALADLRKAVLEETQKATQRAQDISGAIWKDLPVAAAPFILKLLPDASRLASQKLAGAMAVVAAVYLVFSYSIQVYINHRYFSNQKNSRNLWNQALGYVLTSTEIQQFSDAPIEQSVKDYGRVRFLVGIVYFILISILAIYSFSSFTASSPTQEGVVPRRAAPTSGAPALRTEPFPSPKATDPHKEPSRQTADPVAAVNR